jgi:hypothetical protein
MYNHDVLISLQTRAKFVRTHFTTSVSMSVTRYFNMTGCLMVKEAFFFERVHNDD